MSEQKQNPNTQEFWDGQYTVHPNTPDKKWAQLKNHHELWDTVAGLVAEKDIGCPTVLDIGCGPGVLAYLLESQGMTFDYVGMDFSVRARDGFKAYCGEGSDREFCRSAISRNWHKRQIWSMRPDPASRVFIWSEITPKAVNAWCRASDIIICCETLEHLTDDIGIVQAIREGVQPGARVVLSVPIRPGVKYHMRHYGGGPYFDRIEKNLEPFVGSQLLRVKQSWIVGAYDF